MEEERDGGGDTFIRDTRYIEMQSRDFHGNLATGLLGKFEWKSGKIQLRIHALLSHFAVNSSLLVFLGM